MKLRVRKCKLYLREVRWFGRYISKDGIRLDRSRLSALIDMGVPETGADLQQFLRAANWMRQCIPEFTKLIAELHKTL